MRPILLWLQAMLLCTLVSAQQYTHDTAYGNKGAFLKAPSDGPTDAYLQRLKPMPDGSLYMNYTGYGTKNEKGIIRLKPNGKPDSTFGLHGMIVNAASRYGVLQNGQILTGELARSTETEASKLLITRYNNNGSLDESFGVSGKKSVYLQPHTNPMHFQVLSDDKILVFAKFYDPVDANCHFLARLMSDGEIDKTFGNQGFVLFKNAWNINANTITIDHAGNILLSGYIQSMNNHLGYPGALIRLNKDGGLDELFGKSGIVYEQRGTFNEFKDVILSKNGDIITYISFSEDRKWWDGGSLKYSNNGTKQTNFGKNGLLNALLDIPLMDGKFLSRVPKMEGLELIRRLSDGTPDESFGPNGVLTIPLTIPANQWYGLVNEGTRIYAVGKLITGSKVEGALLALKINPIPEIASLTLMNATSDKEIGLLKDKSVINLADVKGKSINIRVDTKGIPSRSVGLQLSGTENRRQMENILPFALFGNTGNNYDPWQPIPGIYSLVAIPYTLPKGAGTAGDRKFVSFKIIDSLALSHLNLVNAKTGLDIQVLKDGDVIDLAGYPMINIRANTGAGTTESVLFGINDMAKFSVESIQPFALAADNNKGRYYPWQVKPGKYTITATPYNLKNAGGKPGYPLTITITVINSKEVPAAVAKKENPAPARVLTNQLWVSTTPNPANAVTQIVYSVAKQTTVSVNILDQGGNRIQQLFRGTASPGVENRLMLPLSAMRSGVYYVEVLTSTGEKAVSKLIKH